MQRVSSQTRGALFKTCPRTNAAARITSSPAHSISKFHVSCGTNVTSSIIRDCACQASVATGWVEGRINGTIT